MPQRRVALDMAATPRHAGHVDRALVRRQSTDPQSQAIGLDRKIGALLAAAGLGTAAEHASISLPALNGLRVSEATGA